MKKKKRRREFTRPSNQEESKCASINAKRFPPIPVRFGRQQSETDYNEPRGGGMESARGVSPV